MREEREAAKKKRWWSLGSTADKHEEKAPPTSKKRIEVVHLRRIAKRGEKAIKHRSEILEKDKVSERDLEITKEVVKHVSETEVIPPPKERVRRAISSRCFECGANMPVDSVRCPKCNVLYVKDPANAAIDDDFPQREERPLTEEHADLFRERPTSFVHFNAVSGVVTCLLNEDGEADFGLECQSCGTVTQLGVRRCPICGYDFEEDDSGLIRLLDGLRFDLDNDNEMDCPACGEHVVLQDGACPSCKEILTYRIAKCKEAGVLPILNERDIVFVHLDVERGELFFARRIRFKKSSSLESIHLDSIDRPGVETSWQSIARI